MDDISSIDSYTPSRFMEGIEKIGYGAPDDLISVYADIRIPDTVPSVEVTAPSVEVTALAVEASGPVVETTAPASKATTTDSKSTISIKDSILGDTTVKFEAV